ncbi:MAG: hypothetical protein ACRDH2_19845, partial [Anaerolineales bacterium]
MNLSYSRPLPSWLANGFRPLLLSAMMACLALAFVELARLFVPAWNGVFVLVGCVLAVWEAFYSERVIRRRWLFFSDRARFRAIELGLFFLFLKAASYIGDSWSSVLAQVQRWPRDPLSFLDLETVLAFCLVLLAWYIAIQTVADLE